MAKSKGKGKRKRRKKVDGSERKEARSPRRTAKRSGRGKMIKIALVIVLILVIVAFALASSQPKEYVSVSDILNNKSRYEKQEVDVRGLVESGSIDTINQTFNLTEGNKVLNVVTDELFPDHFGESKQVIVTGKLNDEGVFEATHIEVGCPSKYESEG